MPVLADYSNHIKTDHDSLCSFIGSRGSLRTPNPILWFEILFHGIHDSSLAYQLEHRCTVSLYMKRGTERCRTLKARVAKFTQQFSTSSASVGLWILFTIALQHLAGGWTKLPVHSFVWHETWHITMPNPYGEGCKVHTVVPHVFSLGRFSDPIRCWLVFTESSHAVNKTKQFRHPEDVYLTSMNLFRVPWDWRIWIWLDRSDCIGAHSDSHR